MQITAHSTKINLYIMLKKESKIDKSTQVKGLEALTKEQCTVFLLSVTKIVKLFCGM